MKVLGFFRDLIISLLLSIYIFWFSPLAKASEWASVHHLIPNTSKEHLYPCSQIVDQDKAFAAAKQCAEAKLKKTLTDLKPECLVVGESSPDVHFDSALKQYFISPSITRILQLVGFYEQTNKTIYITPNRDAEDTYRHELMHYFLHLELGNGDAMHSSILFKECSDLFWSPPEN